MKGSYFSSTTGFLTVVDTYLLGLPAINGKKCANVYVSCYWPRQGAVYINQTTVPFCVVDMEHAIKCLSATI